MKQPTPIPPIDVTKYGGKQVAILNGEVVAAGKTLAEVMAKLKAKISPQLVKKVKFFMVPPTLSVIYVAGIPLRDHP